MRERFKRAVIWGITLVVLMVACLLPTISNVWAAAGSASLTNMNQAARIQLVTNVVRKCVNMVYDTSWSSSNVQYIYPGAADSPFNAFGGDDTVITTGVWLERMVQNKVDDGAIYCKNNDGVILDVLAQLLGVGNRQDIVCNDTEPGFMTLQVQKIVNPDKGIQNWVNVEGMCKEGFGDSAYRFAWRRDKNETLGYLETLYNNYKDSHPDVGQYLPAWSQIDNYNDPKRNYFLFLDEFMSACANSGDFYTGNPSAMSDRLYFASIKEVNQEDGTTLYRNYKKNLKQEKGKDNWKYGITGTGGRNSCSELITGINDNFAAVQEEFNLQRDLELEEQEAKKQAAKQSCQGQKASAAYNLKMQAQRRIQQYEDGEIDPDTGLAYWSEGQYEDAKRVLKEIEDMGGTYWKESPNGGISCIDLPDFDGKIAGVEPPDPDTLPDDDQEWEYDGNVTPGGGTNATSPCFSEASSLGWILCPVIGALGGAVEGVYGWISNQFLFVNTDMTGSQTRTGWTYFRNFANIAFAIILIVIIFSQLTGLGLSNYGIKKMLPTLIIVIVLVNISFFLCQLAIDISNIIGVSLREMFEGLAAQVANNAFEYSVGGIVTGATNSLTGFTSTIWSGALIGGIATVFVAAWPNWLLPFLLALLGIVISIFFFFLLLALRQAGIIILAVISPLAIICYALPNTKKMFSRWWQMFFSLLVLFPICGALMGGTAFASALLIRISGQSFVFYLGAALLQVVPFFMIPSLLRSSMTAIGNIGNKLTNFGARFGRGVNGAIRGSDSFQDAQRRNEMQQARRTFQRIDNGRDLRSRLARGLGRVGLNGAAGNLENAAKRRRARAVDRYDRAAMEDLKAAAGQDALLEGSDRYEAMQYRLEAERLDDAAKSRMAAYRRSGLADNEEAMTAEYGNALDAVIANPTDRAAKERLLAAQRILSKSDTGRGSMENEFYRATADGHAGTDGYKFAGSTLMDEYGADIKARNPAFHSFLLSAAAGKKPEGSFTKLTSNDPDAQTTLNGRQLYRASHYDNLKMDSFDAARLVGADETGLDRMLDSAKNSIEEWSGEQIKDFEGASRSALTNPNLHAQPKVAKKINAIRVALGLSEIPLGQNADSGRQNIRGNGAQSEGEILNTGNDRPSANDARQVSDYLDDLARRSGTHQ